VCTLALPAALAYRTSRARGAASAWLAPQSSLASFEARGHFNFDDPLEQVRSVIGPGETSLSAHLLPGRAPSAAEQLSPWQKAETAAASEDDEAVTNFVELGLGVGKVRSFCEICILVMQMKERGQPHLCAGLNKNYEITCIEILESLLRADKAMVYWLKNGCMHMDSEGPEIVRPCPAINICSWVPNLFAEPPSLVRDGVESLCPKDNKFLPTIPQEFRNLLAAGDSAGANPTAAGDAPDSGSGPN